MRRTLTVTVVTLVATAATALATGSAGAVSDPVRATGPAATALAALGAGPDGAAASGERYTALRTATDADGSSHVRLSRTVHGLPVHGGEVIVHLDRTGRVTGTDGAVRVAPGSTTPRVAADAAARASTGAFSGTVSGVGAPRLVVDASAGNRLAWETVVRGFAPDGQTPSRLHVLSDAGTGAVYATFDEVRTVLGTGRAIYAGPVRIDTTPSGTAYQMIDPSHGGNRTCDMRNTTTGPCVLFVDADNLWGNYTTADRASAAADAHFASAKTYDYFKFVHGRSGRTGTGAGITSRVHYGSNYVNAFYDGTQLTFGDGLGNVHPLTSIDILAHELGHGYTDGLVNLVYSSESGGIDEASSDIWGAMVEFYAAAPGDPGDYLIGEEADIFGTGEPFGNLFDPSLDGSSHSCWSVATPPAPPHVSAGVGKHFFFNLAEGTGATAYGYSPLCGDVADVVGIGRAKAEKIWYRALNVYAVSTATYANMRTYTLAAAADLYGTCSVEQKTVQAAWTAVNVAGPTLCGG
ncbi:M4 family metallopeptidase [Catellatospora bangladeshensis]|uniref:Neutral metalloproteinase n=1 Tax=Catellatospora bangladeshensis TaxID=310355 RepID=A0A8J3JS97_9ACTN|nr:M4 family metallopeptidase [Catellatospora bangladeshensis]GIF82269.1 peptidase [Catellatospora bangladeshensis]